MFTWLNPYKNEDYIHRDVAFDQNGFILSIYFSCILSIVVWHKTKQKNLRWNIVLRQSFMVCLPLKLSFEILCKIILKLVIFIRGGGSVSEIKHLKMCGHKNQQYMMTVSFTLQCDLKIKFVLSIRATSFVWRAYWGM